MILRYMTKSDIALVAVLTLASLGSMLAMRSFALDGGHVLIEPADSRLVEVSLTVDSIHSVSGPLGETIVVVEDSKVHIKSSPCPHHYCERMGNIRRRGEVLVCVPNKVVISIKGGDPDDALDGVTQ